MSPDYFFEKMTVDEAADFLEGARRRKHSFYEALRIGWCLNVSNPDGRSREELFPFPWDGRPKQKRVSKKQRDDLRLKAAAIAQKIQQANVKK